jgi:antitoxin (DNA-binding transcriptional repressor) of toxin-antitoxin stability system
MCHNFYMPTMTMRELRNTRKLKEWLKAGKSVELRDRNNVIGRIVPPQKPSPSVEWPDFEARQKAIFGDRVLNIVYEFIEDRGRY